MKIWIYIVFSVSFLYGGALDTLLQPFTPKEKRTCFLDSSRERQEAISQALSKTQLKNKPSYVLNSRKISEELAVQLKKKFDIEGSLQVSFLHELRSINLPSSNWSLEITSFPANGIRSNLLLPFSIYCDSKLIGQWKMPIRLELWNDAYVSKRELSRGQALTKNFFEIRPIDLLKHSGSIVAKDTDLSKYEMIRPLKTNEALSWRDLEAIPEIRKGQLVDIIASEGFLHITAKGIALENGSGNNFIKVRNIQSKREIHAQVLNDKTVKVYF